MESAHHTFNMIPLSRTYLPFDWKGANFRICSSFFNVIVNEIKRQREILEKYILTCPEFLSALTPIPCPARVPDIVQRMCKAADKTGVGPMAAVAGTIAQKAAEAVMDLGQTEVIVENGGDIYISSNEPVVTAIYAGKNPISGKIAFYIKPDMMPLSLCSSSSTMGHSLSFGKCDLVSVVAKDASLADASATMACNMVFSQDDIEPALEAVTEIQGISGILIIKNNKIGMTGELPELVRHSDPGFIDKVTREKNVWKL